ncbi:sterol desaturase [Sphingopyxis witflariensis]|uniref:Sterol desaturase n=2 Tax=Sphingopyxis witflariensis TaxID=173675 RepID=A0A246JY69_9SPHN|nr:sterol desaturase [Sphingopyxis witflariensis]
MFGVDAGRYVIVAAVTSAIVWGLRRTRLGTRKIQAREATAADMRREMFQSLRSIGVYIVMALLLLWAFGGAGIYQFEGSYGFGADMALLAATIVAHDTYFYWAHRTMHHPKLFKYFHRAHHRSVTPTAWAIYSFAIPEAVVMFAFIPLWLTIVSVPIWVMFMWANFQLIRNAMGHAGFELHPRWWLSSPLTRWINTTTHHDLHHSGGFNTNYGLYFTWWDRLMGTEHPRYAERFAEVVADRSSSPAPAAAAPEGEKAPVPA